MRNLQAILAVLMSIMLGHGAYAQTTDAAKAMEITNDKNGKYTFIETDRAFLLPKGWFAAMHCVTSAQGAVTIRIGKGIFRLPESSLESLLGGALIMEEVNGKYRAWYPSDAGCPENPITAARVELSPPASSPADGLVLRASSPNAAEFAKVLKDLRDHPNDNCMKLKAGALVACTGTFNSVITSFVMATDASMVEESGAPVHARCVTVPELACGIDDDIANGVTFQAALPKGTMHDISPDKLQEIYKAVYATVAHLRARN